MKEISIQEIDDTISYEGYYWLSNQDKPQLVMGSIPKDIFKNLPFVIEANFLGENNSSINIKNIDGKYKVHIANLENITDKNVTSQQFLSHHLGTIKEIKIVQFWEEGQPDEMLAGLKTLIPSWTAFAGFVK